MYAENLTGLRSAIFHLHSLISPILLTAPDLIQLSELFLEV
jgi:hypothetical protein